MKIYLGIRINFIFAIFTTIFVITSFFIKDFYIIHYHDVKIINETYSNHKDCRTIDFIGYRYDNTMVKNSINIHNENEYKDLKENKIYNDYRILSIFLIIILIIYILISIIFLIDDVNDCDYNHSQDTDKRDINLFKYKIFKNIGLFFNYDAEILTKDIFNYTLKTNNNIFITIIRFREFINEYKKISKEKQNHNLAEGGFIDEL